MSEQQIAEIASSLQFDCVEPSTIPESDLLLGKFIQLNITIEKNFACIPAAVSLGVNDVLKRVLENQLFFRESGYLRIEIVIECLWTLKYVVTVRQETFDIYLLRLLRASLELKNDLVVRLSLQYLYAAIFLSTQNKRMVIDEDKAILPVLKKLLMQKDNVLLMLDVACLIRALLLHYEPYQPGHFSFRHALEISNQLMSSFKILFEDRRPFSFHMEILKTIQALAISPEIYMIFDEAGGVEILLTLMMEIKNKLAFQRLGVQTIHKFCCYGNDLVKMSCLHHGTTFALCSLLRRNMYATEFVEVTLTLLSLLFRTPTEGYLYLMNAAIATIVKCMRFNPNSLDIQKTALGLITAEFLRDALRTCPKWSRHGVIEVFRDVKTKFPELEEAIDEQLRIIQVIKYFSSE